MTFPVRKVLERREVRNPDPQRVSRFPTVWVARLSCGHSTDYGGGNMPGASELRCPQCPEVKA